MPLAWTDVEKKPEYQKLPLAEQEKAKAQYFNEVVRPFVPEEKQQMIEQSFYSDTKITPEKPSFMHEVVGKTITDVGMGVVGGVEAAASTAMGALSWIPSKVWGLSHILSGQGEKAARKAEEQVGRFVYQPRTKEGQAAVGMVGKGFELLTTPSKMAAKKVSEHLGEEAGYVTELVAELFTFKLLHMGGKKVSKAHQAAVQNKLQKLSTKKRQAVLSEVNNKLEVLRAEPKRLEKLVAAERKITKKGATERAIQKITAETFDKAVKEMVGTKALPPGQGFELIGKPKRDFGAELARQKTKYDKIDKAKAAKIKPGSVGGVRRFGMLEKKEPAIRIKGRIQELGGIKWGEKFKGEGREVPLDVKFLSKKRGMAIDTLEHTLKEEGWLRKNENLMEMLRSDARNTLNRSHPSINVLQKKRSHLTAQEKKFVDQMNFEPEAPPELLKPDRADNLGKLMDFFDDKAAKPQTVKAGKGKLSGVVRQEIKAKGIAKVTPKGIKGVLKSERGAIELPETAKSKHQRFISKNPALKKVHGMIGKEKKSFSLSGNLSKVNKVLFDRFAPIKKVSPETYNEARRYAAYKDVAKIKYNELVKGLKNIKNDELLFTDYISAHRALSRSERGLKNPNKVTLTDAKTAIKAMETEWTASGRNVKALKDSFNYFQNWSNKYILKEARDSGMISKKAYQDIKKNNRFYATFEVLDHLPPEINKIPSLPSKEYFSVANQSVIKRMIGTEKLISNPIEATVKKFAQAQATFARNKVASTMVDSTSAKKILQPIAMNAKEYAIMKNKGLSPVMDRAWSKKEFGVINRFKDGRVERYLAPIELAETMKQLTPAQAPRVIQAINSVFRKSATTLYLPFTISNAMRDAYMAYTTAPVYKATSLPRFAKDWSKGFWEGAKHEFAGRSDLAKEYVRSGGGFGYVGNLRKANLAKQGLFKKGMIKKASDIITSPLDLIEHISATIELAPRLGIFDRAKMMKFKTKDAALIAKQSTIDFNRGGTWTKVANQWIPFLNARVQGRVTLANALKRDPGGTLSKVAVSVIVPGALTYAWNRLYHSDAYDDIPEYIKQNYFCIITGKGKDYRGKEVPRYVVISKGDVGQMAWNPIEFGLDNMWEKDREGTGAFLLNYLNDLSPVEFAREGKLSLSKAAGGLTPPIIKGFVEDWANISLYRGHDIIPYYMKKTKPPELQYKKNTPASYKWLGEKLKVSPLRLQNFASNILAGYGREGLDPSAMLRGLTGRLVKTRGGEKENKTWIIIKDIEQGYLYTRAYANELIENGQRSAAISLLNEWNSGLNNRIKLISKYGFKDKGGLQKAYRFTTEKRRGLLLKRKNSRTPLEKKLSSR